MVLHKIGNRPVLADSVVAYSCALSFGAKGLAVIIENEQDPDFEVIPVELSERFPCNSPEEIQGYIDELLAFGYLGIR
jgi:hypothetical protein